MNQSTHRAAECRRRRCFTTYPTKVISRPEPIPVLVSRNPTAAPRSPGGGGEADAVARTNSSCGHQHSPGIRAAWRSGEAKDTDAAAACSTTTITTWQVLGFTLGSNCVHNDAG